MTTFSAAKDNPKGYKKAGSELAIDGETRKHLVRFSTKMGEDSQSQGEDGQDAFVTKKVDDKNVANDIDIEELNAPNDVDMAQDNDTGASDELKGARKWDDLTETMDIIEADEDEVVNKWEQEIDSLEKEYNNASTEEYKKLVEKWLIEAQFEYKVALIRLTRNREGVTMDSAGKVDFSNIDDDGTFEGMNESRSDSPSTGNKKDNGSKKIAVLHDRQNPQWGQLCVRQS